MLVVQVKPKDVMPTPQHYAMKSPPKYSEPEIERRWVVPAAAAEEQVVAQPYRLLEDRYILGTRLRLRKVSGPTTVFKLGKKYDSSTDGAEQVVSVYLAEEEHDILASLPHHLARKRRYSIAGGSIDQYLHPRRDLFVFEVEFQTLSEAEAFLPPAFVDLEVTGDPRYSGFAIATEV